MPFKRKVKVNKRFKSNIEKEDKYSSETEHEEIKQKQKHETDSHVISLIDPLSIARKYINIQLYIDPL